MHHSFEFVEAQFRLARDEPLLRERVAHLQNLDVVERFFEQQEIVAHAEPLRHRVPRIIGEGGADDDLDRRVFFPKLLDRLHAIPSRRHPHVHERQRVRLALGDRPPDFLERVAALKCGINAEFRDGIFPLRLIAEQQGFRGVERRVPGLRAEQDFFEVLVDRGIVVHEQDAMVGLEDHAAASICAAAQVVGSARRGVLGIGACVCVDFIGGYRKTGRATDSGSRTPRGNAGCWCDDGQ